MAMNIVPPANNMIINNIPTRNERINANDVFNSGADDHYSNYRTAKSQEKKKAILPVKEHPLLPRE